MASSKMIFFIDIASYSYSVKWDYNQFGQKGFGHMGLGQMGFGQEGLGFLGFGQMGWNLEKTP